MLLLMNDKSWKAPWERDLSRDEFRPIEMNEIFYGMWGLSHKSISGSCFVCRNVTVPIIADFIILPKNSVTIWCH